jgi:hypothetical protein
MKELTPAEERLLAAIRNRFGGKPADATDIILAAQYPDTELNRAAVAFAGHGTTRLRTRLRRLIVSLRPGYAEDGRWII